MAGLIGKDVTNNGSWFNIVATNTALADVDNGIFPRVVPDPFEPDTKSAMPFWFGLPITINAFDPFSLSFDFIYGDNGYKNAYKRSGWYTAASASYKLPYFTPRLNAWYSSGDSSDASNGSEKLPTILGAQAFTNFGFGGSINSTFAMGKVVSSTVIGTWGLSLEAGNIRFIDKLSHTLRLSYYQGTNSSKLVAKNSAPYKVGNNRNVYMTNKDSAIEFNFENAYQAYDNLTLRAGFNIIFPDFDKKTWGQDFQTRNIWAITTGFFYGF